MSNLDEQRKLARESMSRENEYKNNQKEYGGRMAKSANELHEDFCKTLIALEVIIMKVLL